MKFKHNKKRNTAFLYEVLIKELTKTVVLKESKKKDSIVNIMKKYFSSSAPLGKELRIYRDLNETTAVDLYTAERLLVESKKSFNSLDRKEIFNLQTNLINEINQISGRELFNNFVPNYKSLATIYQIFLNQSSTKETILLERKVLSRMVSKSTEALKQDLPHINNLTLSTFIRNYNNKYSTELTENQQELLNKYILSFSDNSLELKAYLNEEIGRLKEEVTGLMVKEDVTTDSDIQDKMKEVHKMLESFSSTKIDQRLITKVLKIQNLIKEVNE